MGKNFPIVKVRLEAGVVVEAYAVWDEPEHLKDWQDAPIEVGPNWRFVDGEFLAPETVAPEGN